MANDEANIIKQLLGPLGGVTAIGFGSGWLFRDRSCKSEIKRLDDKIDKLGEKLDERAEFLEELVRGKINGGDGT